MTRITVEKSVKRGNIAGVKWDDYTNFVAELNGEEDISKMVDSVFGLFILLGYTPQTVYESFHEAANNSLEAYWPENKESNPELYEKDVTKMWFEFAEYFRAEWDFKDNTSKGNVYVKKTPDGNFVPEYTIAEVFEEWREMMW